MAVLRSPHRQEVMKRALGMSVSLGVVQGCLARKKPLFFIAKVTVSHRDGQNLGFSEKLGFSEERNTS